LSISGAASLLPAEERTSQRLRSIVDRLTGDRVRIGFLLVKLRRRSFGGLFILLSVLSLVLGISLFIGLAMVLPALQLASGQRAPIMPRFMRRREVPVAQLRKFVAAIMPWLERLERVVRPRWPTMTRSPMANITGMVIIFLALVIVLPLPFSNFPPAVAIVVLALGIIERDGLLVALGLTASLVALSIGVVISITAAEGASFFVHRYFG
jgi:hypothetical protein